VAVLGQTALSEQVDSVDEWEAKVVVMSALDWQVDLITLACLLDSAFIVCEGYFNLSRRMKRKFSCFPPRNVDSKTYIR
jgi:hypothetical protein